MDSSKLSEVLTKSIGVTGDVDTVGAIAMAAAANCKEIENDLANYPFLEGGLEDGKYGKTFLKSLDEKLMSLKGA
jgi:hypothetical protein